MAIKLGFSDSIFFEKLINAEVILNFAICSFAFIVAFDVLGACSFKITPGSPENVIILLSIGVENLHIDESLCSCFDKN